MTNNNQNTKDLANIVLDVYRYANKHNLDITNPEAVKETLRTLKIKNFDEINIETVIQGLVALNKITKDDVIERNKKISN